MASELGALDRGLYALFARHADRRRHERDRERYRAAALRTDFDLFLSRVYGVSWAAYAVAFLAATVVAMALPPGALAAAADVLGRAPLVGAVAVPRVPRIYPALAVAAVGGLAAKAAVVRSGGLYLRWVAEARRADIERTLPGAVRYLRALSAGSDDSRLLLRKVAEQDAYGETAGAFRSVLTRATLTGSVAEALRGVARDTPSRDLLAPFLLKFREHANQGPDALADYLRMESRMLSHRQSRARRRAGDFLELLGELFVVLLVLPALLVIVLTVVSVLAPGLSAPVETPVGDVPVRGLLVYASALFALVVGLLAAWLVLRLRPPDQAPPAYTRPGGHGTVLSATTNPASAAVVVALPAAAVAAGLWSWGTDPVVALLGGYATYGLPVGTVAVRRARRDDAKDRELKDFVHAVAGHVGLGRPFDEAVARVAEEVDLGPLGDDVEDLAFNLGLTTTGAVPTGDGAGTRADGDVRTEALDRFVGRVGTPMAAQTIGLVTGALEVGSDSETVFDTLQTEVGRLHHQKKALRRAMLVYVAVGWTTALLVVGIMIAVHTHVLAGFDQLSAVGAGAGPAVAPDAIDPARDRHRFYVVAQATMLACGWFAGAASRGAHEALLHSAALVVVCHLAFAGVALV